MSKATMEAVSKAAEATAAAASSAQNSIRDKKDNAASLSSTLPHDDMRPSLGTTSKTTPDTKDPKSNRLENPEGVERNGLVEKSPSSSRQAITKRDLGWTQSSEFPEAVSEVSRFVVCQLLHCRKHTNATFSHGRVGWGGMWEAAG